MSTLPRRVAALCGVALLALPAIALAQARPRLEPTRDVAVTYRTTTPGQREARLTAAFLASERLLRVDLPDRGWGLLDRRSGRLRVVLEQMRMVMDAPADELAGMGIPVEPGPGARFTREGEARVAGLACTNWRYEEGERSGTACLTADGVLLRGEGRSGRQHGGIEAVEVRYVGQEPARFRLPEGYPTMRLPQGLPPGLAGTLPNLDGLLRR